MLKEIQNIFDKYKAEADSLTIDSDELWGYLLGDIKELFGDKTIKKEYFECPQCKKDILIKRDKEDNIIQEECPYCANENEAFYIESKEFIEDEDDKLIIRVIGEDNMNELIQYLKDYNRVIH